MATKTLDVSKKYLRKHWQRNLAFVVLGSLPVFVFIVKFSLINRHGVFVGEDWDYFAQSYEAARQSILSYHQFPWWNPWVNGGQPLFANPQFGLFSIQMPLVLLFGTVAGLHASILFYYIIGFWGIYLLLRRINCESRIIALLLSYIWVFGGFAAWHIGGGHLTFAIYLLSPWAFLTLLNIHRPYGWLKFSLVITLLIQSAAHYLTFETIIICVLIALIQITRSFVAQSKREPRIILNILKPYLYASVLVIALCGMRLFYTLQFTHQFPRFQNIDPAVSIKVVIAALMFRHPVDPGALTTYGDTHYGWSEYASYFGILTLALLCYWVIRSFERIRSTVFSEKAIFIATCLALLLTFGAFAAWSPYSIVHHLPVFDQMRVPSRFICWFMLGAILLLARLPRKPLFYVILALSAMDVFAANYGIVNYGQRPYIQKTSSQAFQQFEFYKTDPDLGVANIMNIQDLRLLRATQQNIGEVYGYEPILNVAEYYFEPGTNRCGANKGCEFVLTKNARVTNWSPQKITLTRTGPGDIKLNMNPGSPWRINGKQIFAHYKLLELRKDFVISDKSQHLTVEYSAAP